MGRWSVLEEEQLAQMKVSLKYEIDLSPKYPEVVGERRMLRFLRGNSHDVHKAVDQMRKFLNWRHDNNVDAIRDNIVNNGMNEPRKFPFGELILSVCPQVVLSAKAHDNKKNPIAIEQFCFNPKDILDRVSIEEYIIYLTYSLEYKSLILEQLSEEVERDYIRTHSKNNDASELIEYGVVLRIAMFRDLKGLGTAHVGAQGQNIIKAVIKLASPNYPESLAKSYVINAPYVFNMLWYFIKGMLDPNTIAKVNIFGSDFYPTLIQEFPLEHIPTICGGTWEAVNEPFLFDTKIGGALYTPCTADTLHSPQTGVNDTVGRVASTSSISSENSSTTVVNWTTSNSPVQAPALTQSTVINTKGRSTSLPTVCSVSSFSSSPTPPLSAKKSVRILTVDSDGEEIIHNSRSFSAESIARQESYASIRSVDDLALSSSMKNTALCTPSPSIKRKLSADGKLQSILTSTSSSSSIYDIIVIPYLQVCSDHPILFVFVCPCALLYAILVVPQCLFLLVLPLSIYAYFSN